MSRQLSLVVFDWDGTLMDSERIIVDSMQRAFREQGLVPPPPQAVRQVIGLALDRAILCLLPDGTARQLQAVESGYRHFFRHNPGPSPLFDEVEAVLAELRGSDYVLAVATGKSRAGLERAIEHSGLQGVFSATRCADQCASKPAPEMLEQLLAETGFEPHQAIMVGDTTYDLEMARNAGTFSAAACYGAHGVDELQRCEPVFYLERIRELPDKLERFAAGDRGR